MIRENQKSLNIVLIITDIVIITAALIFAWYIRFDTRLLGVGISGWGLNVYLISLAFIIVVYIFLYYTFGLYDPQRTKSFTSEAIQIFKINGIGLLILITSLYLIEVKDYSRFLLAMFAIFSTTFAITERYLLKKTLSYARSKGFNVQFLLIIGAGDLGQKVATKITENYYLGYQIIGFLDDNIPKGEKIISSNVLGTVDELEKVILSHTIDVAVITISARHYALIEDIVNTLEKYGVKAEIVPDFYRYFPAKPYIDMIDDIPVINMRYVPLDNTVNRLVKRVSDIFLAVAGIIVTSPILIVAAIMVKISSPGPIIYKQERVGANRKNFNMYKFRSMQVQKSEFEKYMWSKEDDPRKTKFGAFIRRTNIDELPQLFNILKGDMSLIGPRPERPFFVEKFRDEIPKYMVKHHVRPGMTGFAQINGFRGNTSITKRVEHDIYYVENWNFFLDVKIFFMTFRNFFQNAY